MKKNKVLTWIIAIICLAIIIAGIVVTAVFGLKSDIFYSKNIRIDVYLGKEFNHDDIEQLAKEVFGTNRALVQQVEYYGDMFTLTISKDVENVDEKVEQFNTKINEKYELENKKEDIQVTYQPNIKLSSIVTPYIVPLAISLIISLVYAVVRFRKIGIFKTLGMYIISIVLSEAIYLSIISICRIPVNRLVAPIGLLIYLAVIIVVTVIREKKLDKYVESEKKKKK